MTLGKTIADRPSIADLVATWEAVECDIRASFGTIDAALARLKGTIAGTEYGFDLRDRHAVAFSWDEPDRHLRELRREVWRSLIERMQVRRAMSIAAWNELTKQIEKGEPPPITIATVEGMIEGFKARVPDMLKQAIDEVFDFLRPPGSRYKTNTEFELGERVVLSYIIEAHCWSPTYWRVDHDREQHLLALENVFRMLDGRVIVQNDGRYYSDLSTAIKQIPISEPCHGETELFEFRGHKNRNLHLRFRRMDLVKKLNAVAGGARLKPPADGF